MNGTLAQVIQFRTRSAGYGWVVMGFLWAVNLLIPLAAVSLGIMLPPMTEELGISPIEAGLLGASWFLGSALVSLPASIWLSRFSPKWVTFYSTFLAGVLLLVQGWAPSFGVLLFARFIFVIVVVCRVQAEVLLVHQWFTQARVAVVMSLTIGIMSIGQLAAVGLIPVLMDMFSGWRNVYMGLGAGLLVGAALWMVVGRERVTPTAPETERARGASPLRVLRRYRFLWVLAAAPSGAALAWGSLMTFWPTLALDNPGTLAEGRGRPHDAVSRGAASPPLSWRGLSPTSRGAASPSCGCPDYSLPPIYIALYTTEIAVVAGILLLVAGWNAMIWVPIIRINSVRPPPLAEGDGRSHRPWHDRPAYRRRNGPSARGRNPGSDRLLAVGTAEHSRVSAHAGRRRAANTGDKPASQAPGSPNRRQAAGHVTNANHPARQR